MTFEHGNGKRKHQKQWIILNEEEVFERYDFACAIYDERYIFIAGGYGDGNYTALSAMYDIKKNEYISLPKLPVGFSGRYCNGAIIKEYFYVLSLDEMYRLDISSYAQVFSMQLSNDDTKWEKIHPPSNIYAQDIHAIISDGNHLYLFGYKISYRFDPRTNDCTTLPAMSTLRGNFASAIVKDSIYIIGGVFGGVSSVSKCSSVEVFHIPSNTWTETKPLPQALAHSSATVIGNRYIVVLGGSTIGDLYSTQSYIFDTHYEIWYVNDICLLPPRIFHSCVTALNGKFIASLGGEDDAEKSCTVEMIHRKYLTPPSWDTIGYLVLLRELLHRERAHPMDMNDNKKCKIEKIIHGAMIDLNLDIFAQIISFLI